MINLLRKKSKPSTEQTSNEEGGGIKAFFHKVLFFLNVLSLIPLLLAMLGWFVPSTYWEWPTLMAVITKQLLLVPILWALFWAFQSVKFTVLNLAILVLNYNNIMATVQFHKSKPKSTKDVKIMSINVDAFEYKFEKLQKTVAYLKEKNPDVICMQEFRDALDSEIRAIGYIKKELGLKNYAFVELMPNKNFGLAIFSKFPILDGGNITELDNSTKNGVMFADIKMYGKTLRFYNIHLESYNFNQNLPENTNELSNNSLDGGQSLFQLTTDIKKSDSDSTEEEDKPKPRKKKKKKKSSGEQSIVSKMWDRANLMTKVWPKQLEQIATYEAHADKCKYPMVVCGDLNNPPYNYIYKTAKRDLQDCFQARGTGWGCTKTDAALDFRIDYIFASEKIQIIDFQTLKTNAAPHFITDHSALLTRVRLSK